MSLVGRLSLVFFAFTLLNVLLFWLATGSNQMRLIAEKASLEMHRTLSSVEMRLSTFVHETAERQKADFYKRSEAMPLLLTVFQDSQKITPQNLLAFEVIANNDKILSQWPQATQKRELSPNELQNLVKALRLKEFKNEPFYSSPDVLAYRLIVYMPFLSDNGQNLVLRASYSLESMRLELHRLMRVGIAIVVLLLVIQALLGYLLYRMIVRPLRRLRIASHAIGRGDVARVEGYENRKDEIGTLIETFNKMSADILEQKETIRRSYEEIKSRDDLMQHELLIAQRIQESTFPKGENPHPMALEYKPLYAVSGDFYDIFTFADGSTGYLVCDASGHGVPAALLTMLAKSAFGHAIQTLNDPGSIMRSVNQQISASLEMTGQYLTAFYVRITHDRIEYCNATHPEPMLVQDSVVSLPSNGFYVGMMVDTPFAFETATLERKAGSKLILYTDGISEGKNAKGELFGVERLRQIAASHAALSAAQLKEKILGELQQFTQGVAAEDDITLLVIEL